MTTPTGPGPALTEDVVRQRLQSALDEMTPSERVVELGVAVRRRRRVRRVVKASSAAAVTAAAAAAVVVLGVGESGSRQLIAPAHHPQQLIGAAARWDRYVRSNGGTESTGPVQASGGTFGVFVAKGRLIVSSFDGSRWSAQAHLAPPVSRIRFASTRRGPTQSGDAAAFQVDTAGGDAVFTAVAVRVSGSWRYARFDCGRTSAACAEGRGTEADWVTNGFERAGVFHSDADNCVPNCAAGRTLNVTWRWNRDRQLFEVVKAVPEH